MALLLPDVVDFLPLFPLDDEETVLARMLASAQEIGDAYGITFDTREPGLLRTAITPGSREIASEWDALGTEVPASAMVLWSWAPYLDDLAVPVQIERLAATRSTGVVRFASAASTPIAPGVTVSVLPSTPDATGPSFQVTGPGGTIPPGGSIDLPVVAVLPGVAGDVAANAITNAETPLPGVTLTNPAATSGGTDTETDDALRNRIIDAFRGLGPGNVHDYERWAHAIAGVGRVTIIPLFAGPGTVLVVVATADGDPVSGATVTAVQEAIDPPAFETTLTSGITLPVATVPVATTAGARPAGSGWIRLGDQLVQYASFDADSFNGCTGGTGTFPSGAAVTQSGRAGGDAPVGAHVVVKTAALLAVTITGTVELEPGYSLAGDAGTTAVQAAIEQRLAAYINSVQAGSEVVLKKVESAIVNVAGVHDVKLVKINGNAANLAVGADPPQAPSLTSAPLVEGAVP